MWAAIRLTSCRYCRPSALGWDFNAREAGEFAQYKGMRWCNGLWRHNVGRCVALIPFVLLYCTGLSGANREWRNLRNKECHPSCSLSSNYPAVCTLFLSYFRIFACLFVMCELLLAGYRPDSSLHTLLHGDLFYCAAVVCYFLSTRSTYQLRLAVNKMSVRLSSVTVLINSG